MLEEKTRVHGLDSVEVVFTKDNLAMDFYDLEEFDKAKVLLQEVVKSRRETLGRSHQESLLSSFSLGLTLQKQEEWLEAETLFREVLALRELTLGCNHMLTIDTIDELPTCLREQKKQGEAVSLADDSLQRHKVELGDRHTDTISALRYLASSLCLAEKFPDAEATYCEYFEMRKRCPEKDVKIMLRALQNFGFVLCSTKKYLKAERSFRKACKGRQIILGLSHEDTILSAGSLLTCLWAQKKLEQAEQLCLTFIPLSETTLGKAHQQTILFLLHLANILNAQGRVAENIEMLKHILERLKGNHQGVFLRRISFQNLVNALFGQKHYREAHDCLKQYSNLQISTCGSMSLEVTEIALQFDLITYEQGRFSASRDSFDKARVIYEACGRVVDEGYLKIKTSISELLCKLNRFKEARSLCDKALVLDNSLSSSERPAASFDSRARISRILYQLRQYDDAETRGSSVIADGERTLPKNHTALLATRKTLARIMWRTDRRSEALSLIRETSLKDLESRELNHTATLDTAETYGDMLGQIGKIWQGELVLRATWTKMERELGNESSRPLGALRTYVLLLARAFKTKART